MEKIWLISRKNQISGPFTEEQINEMLDNKSLSFQDKITSPLKKWVYIKNTTFNPEYTTYSSTDPSAEEPTIALEDDEPPVTEVKDQTFSDADEDLDLDQAVSVAYDAKDEIVEKQHAPAEFGSIDQIQATAHIQSLKFLRIAYSVLGFSFAIAIGVYLWQSLIVDKREQEVLTKKNLIEARQFFSKGEYEKALNLFKKVPLTHSQDRLSVSSLLFKLEGDSYGAETHLEDVAGGHENPEDQMREFVLQGMIEYQNGNYQGSQDYFHKAKSLSSSNLAPINNVVLHIQMDRPEQAMSILNNVSVNKENKNFILFLKSYLSILSKEKVVDEMLHLVIDQKRDYAQESHLIKLYRDIVVNRKTNTNELIRDFLDQDPYLTQDHFYDILSYHPQQVWKNFLLNLCHQVVQESKGQSVFMALYSLCLSHSGLLIEAHTNIKKTLDQSPKDPLIQSLYAYILLRKNEMDLSQVPLQQAIKNNEDDQYILPFILQARWCELNRQFKCAESYWKKVREHKTHNLSSLGGLARVYRQLGLKKEYSQLQKEGLKIAPHYKAFLPL